MSIEATVATYKLLPELKERLLELPARRRPAYYPTALVALRLAECFRDKRGYTDETVAQLVQAVCAPENTVRTALAALDQLGYWERLAKGNQHFGTRRRPTYLDSEHRGADPAEQEFEDRGADPTERPDGASWGSGPSIVGYDSEHRGADPATPPSTPTGSPHRAAAEEAARAHIDAVIASRVGTASRVRTPDAFRYTETPIAAAIAERELEAGRDPSPALHEKYPVASNGVDSARVTQNLADLLLRTGGHR